MSADLKHKILTEGGHVFPDAVPFDQKYAKAIVSQLQKVLKPTGIQMIIIGSSASPTPGKMSGDLDMMVDASQVQKYFNEPDAKSARKALRKYFDSKGYQTAQSGVSVHVNVPIGNDHHQVDVMTVGNASDISKFHIHSLPQGSPYKGLHKQQLLSTIAREQGYLWSGWEGLYRRDDEGKKSDFITRDLGAAAKLLLSPTATAADMGSVEAILKAAPADIGLKAMQHLETDVNWKPLFESVQASASEIASDTKLLGDFLRFAAKELDIELMPKIKFIRNGSSQKSFGWFDPNTDEICVQCVGRHIMDVLRTIAHELIHYIQRMNDELHNESGITGSRQENQANAQAGILMRSFADQHPDAFSKEEELTEFKIDNAYGAGATPNNENIDYLGLRVEMKPSVFLKLALPMEDTGHLPRMRDLLSKGGAIGAPFLVVDVPNSWYDGDLTRSAKITTHEGRHRMTVIRELEGDVPVETHIQFTNAKRRHITDEMIARLNRSLIPERQTIPLPGPFFTVKEQQMRANDLNEVVEKSKSSRVSLLDAKTENALALYFKNNRDEDNYYNLDDNDADDSYDNGYVDVVAKNKNAAKQAKQLKAQILTGSAVLIKRLITDCGKYLSEIKKAGMGSLPYRGVSTPMEFAFKSQSKDNRKPKDSDVAETKMFNSFISQLGFTSNRTNSIFVIGDYEDAVQYAEDLEYGKFGAVYVVVPKNSATFMYSQNLNHQDLVLDPNFINSRTSTNLADPTVLQKEHVSLSKKMDQLSKKKRLKTATPKELSEYKFYKKAYDLYWEVRNKTYKDVAAVIKQAKMLAKYFPKCTLFTTPEKYITISKTVSLAEFQKEFSLTDKNFAAGLKLGNEIAVHGEFYAIDCRYWQLIAKQLGCPIS